MEIIDDNNTYPALLGIDWAIDMNGVIILKKRTMLFERKSLRVVILLDPVEGPRYIEPVHECEEIDDDLDQIYKITVRDQDWINSIANEWIVWDHKYSCTSDSDEELEHKKIGCMKYLHCTAT